MLKNLKFHISDHNESTNELSNICLLLERYGLISDYVFASIHSILGEIYSKEIKKLIKEMDLDKGSKLGESFFPNELIQYVANRDQFVIDYRNSILHAINSTEFIIDHSQINDAALAVKSMR